MPWLDEATVVEPTQPKSGWMEGATVLDGGGGQPPSPEPREDTSFTGRLSRAFERFKNTVQGDGTLLGNATTVFRIPEAVAGLVQDSPGGEALAPAAQAVKEYATKPQGLFAQTATPILEHLKAVHEDDDTAIQNYGKALRNVAIDLGIGALTPLGAAATAGSALVAPEVAAASATPFVLKAIKDAVKADFGDDQPDRLQRAEKELTALVGTAGLAEGLRSLGAPKVPPVITPDMGIAQEGLAAAPKLEAELGVEAPLTAAQQTGSKGMAQSEGMMRKIGVGLGTRMNALDEKQFLLGEAVKDEIAARAKSTPEEAGKASTQELRSGEQAAAGDVRTKSESALGEVSGAEEAYKRGFTSTPQELTDTGKQVREGAQLVTDFSSRMKDRAYADRDAAIAGVLGRPDAPFITPDRVRVAAQGILNDAAKRNVPVPTGLLNAFSQPIMTVQRQVMPEFLKAYDTIRSIASWDSPQSVAEMQRARSTLGEAIGRMSSGAADAFGGGFQLGDLKHLYGDLKEDNNAAINKLGPKVASLHQKAEAIYKRAVELKEQSPVIAKVLSESPEGGISNTADIVTQFARGEGTYDDLLALKQIIPTHTYASLRRGILDSLQGNAEIPTATGSVMDLTKLRTSFQNLAPEFKRELFGSDKAASDYQAVLDRFGTAKKANETLGGIVPASSGDMAQLIVEVRNGRSKAGAKQLEDAIAAEVKRKENYFNDITKRTNENTLGEIEVNPAQLVDDFLFQSTNPEAVLRSLQQLTPATRDAVQNAAAKRLFEEAAGMDQSTIGQIVDKDAFTTSKKLIELMVNNPKRREVIEAVIPDSSRELIHNYLKYQRAIDQAYRAARDQGLVASSTLFSNLFGVIVKLPILKKVSDVMFSDAGQAYLRTVARENKVLPIAAAAEAVAQRMGLKGRWTQEQAQAVRDAMTRYFPQPAIQDYFRTKAGAEAAIDQMKPEEQKIIQMSVPFPTASPK